MAETPVPVQIEQRGEVSWITFSRPEKSNALDVAMQAQIIAHFETATVRPDIKAIVLTGAGARAFCAGVDIAETRPESPEVAARIRSHQLFATCLALIDCPKPVVAAVNGHAVGAGCILALLADARIAVPEASLSLPEILLGAPTFAGIAVVSRALGDIAAADLVQSGRRMGATEAASRHLFAEICELQALEARAQALALKLAGNSPLAFGLNKAWLHRETRLLLELAREDADKVRGSVAAARSNRAPR